MREREREYLSYKRGKGMIEIDYKNLQENI